MTVIKVPVSLKTVAIRHALHVEQLFVVANTDVVARFARITQARSV